MSFVSFWKIKSIFTQLVNLNLYLNTPQRLEIAINSAYFKFVLADFFEHGVQIFYPMKLLYYLLLALLVLTEIIVFVNLIYFFATLSIYLISKLAYFLLQYIDKLLS